MRTKSQQHLSTVPLLWFVPVFVILFLIMSTARAQNSISVQGTHFLSGTPSVSLSSNLLFCPRIIKSPTPATIMTSKKYRLNGIQSPPKIILLEMLSTRETQATKELTKAADPLYQIYICDSALVLSTHDTLRYTPVYKSTGQIALGFIERWTNGHWANFRRDTVSYDANGRILSTLHQQWANDRWIDSMQNTYTFDANGNVLTYLYQEWSNGILTYASLDSCSYNGYGNTRTSLYEHWSNGQWTRSWMDSVTYDANGNISTEMYEHWFNGQASKNLITYTYDADRRMISEFDQNWNDGQWTNSQLRTYTYNSMGNMITHLYQIWLYDQWANLSLECIGYSPNGMELSWLEEIWAGGQWTNSRLYSYTYNMSGNVVSELFQKWENGQWTNTTQHSYSYDRAGNIVSESTAKWGVTSWLPNDSYFSVPGNSASALIGYTISRFFSPEHETGVQTTDRGIIKDYALLQNYPNPFNPSTTIQYEIHRTSRITLKVFDLIGHEVVTLVDGSKSAGSYSVMFDGTKYSSGIYFVRMTAASQDGSDLITKTMKMLMMK